MLTKGTTTLVVVVRYNQVCGRVMALFPKEYVHNWNENAGSTPASPTNLYDANSALQIL